MRARIVWVVVTSLVVPLAVAGALTALADNTEIEPNNTPATANALAPNITMNGAITPVLDLDYYVINGINPTWGFIALLDTLSSTTSTSGRLMVLHHDGATVVNFDTGSWERGSGIALQSFVDGASALYLRVNQQTDSSTISRYRLRYIPTIVTAQPEVEPNDTRASGTPSSFTESGVISSPTDVDCYAFHGRAGDEIILALTSVGGSLDPVLKLVAPSNAVLKTVNFTGVGGQEFIDYAGLPGDGVYAYCVSAAGGTGGIGAVYTVGLTRNGGLYFPAFTYGSAWLNQPAAGFARVNDLLSFRLAVTNTSPLTIPGNIRLTTSFAAACLLLAGAVPTPTTSSAGYISWDGQKNGLAPGEVYSVTFTARGRAPCNDSVYQDTGLGYYFTGIGDYLPYDIRASAFLPLVQRGP
jgi:hypothetical protein